MAASGSTALQTDYNTTRNTAMDLLTIAGGTSKGYGQLFGGYSFYSSAVTSSTVMGTNEWNNLRYDLFNIRAHQIGTNPAIAVAATAGNTIAATDANNFASLISTYNTDRATAHSSRVTTTTNLNGGPTNGIITRTSSWQNSLQTIILQNFNGSSYLSQSQTAEVFYNSGGQFRMSTSRTGGSVSSQNTAWTNLLSTVGTLTFGYTDYWNFRNNFIGAGWKSWYTVSDSAPYALNSFNIDVNMTQPNFIYFRITWADLYSDPSPGNAPAPDDLVDGTLSLNLSQQYNPGGFAMSPNNNKWLGFTNTGAAQTSNGYTYNTYPLPNYSEVKSGTWTFIGS